MNWPLAATLILAATGAGAAGALFLKLGAPAFSISPRALLRNRSLIIGGVLYVGSMACYLALLRSLPLTIAYPLTALQYIWVILLSRRFLGEEVQRWHWIGVGLIIMGVGLLFI